MAAARRRLRLRETTVTCECGTAKRIRWWPLTYVRLTREQERDETPLHDVKCCVCGAWVTVTAGDVRRAA